MQSNEMIAQSARTSPIHSPRVRIHQRELSQWSFRVMSAIESIELRAPFALETPEHPSSVIPSAGRGMENVDRMSANASRMLAFSLGTTSRLAHAGGGKSAQFSNHARDSLHRAINIRLAVEAAKRETQATPGLFVNVCHRA